MQHPGVFYDALPLYPSESGKVRSGIESGDYLGQSSTSVCHTQAAINRFGLDELTAWVNMPLPENIVCMELDGRKIISDETVRQLIIQKCGIRSMADFQLLSKERQKDVAREVMLELGAGPRQMSRLTGLSYTQNSKLSKKG